MAVAGCANTTDKPAASEAATVNKITAEEARARLDNETGIILVDVRTQDEYNVEHIPNAILLPVDNIVDDAETIIPDKEATYFVYCRSGNRSATASAQLVEMEYKNIYDLGGIKDWPYEKISGQ
jgi:rhodanese-related sulfurtransferase